MQILKYKKEEHYDTMLSLWKKRNWQPCAAEMLPKIGLVLYHENRFIAYMGIYIESGTMGFVGWALTNPDENTTLNDKALKELFTLLLDIGKNKNCKLIYSITDEKEWGKRLKDYGMTAVEEGVSVYAMFLKEK